MLPRKTIQNTKNFFHKTIQNLRSLLIGEYQKLPKAPFFRSFSCSKGSSLKIHQLDHFYADFANQEESDQDLAKKRKNKSIKSSDELTKEDGACSESFMKHGKQALVMNKQEERGNKEKSKRSTHEGKRAQPSSRNPSEEGYVLAQKMKELEKMDGGDVDHVLDIEEVLHYYSRLRSPVYLDIVDKFFTDMYSEFFHPQASVSNKNSQRKLGLR